MCALISRCPLMRAVGGLTPIDGGPALPGCIEPGCNYNSESGPTAVRQQPSAPRPVRGLEMSELWSFLRPASAEEHGGNLSEGNEPATLLTVCREGDYFHGGHDDVEASEDVIQRLRGWVRGR